MADRIRYYMDEHVPRAVTDGLRRRGVDALTVQAAGTLGADDERQLEYASQEGRVIVTQDADFLRLHSTGHQHRGIVYVPQRTSIGDIIRGLMLIHDVLDPEEIKGHVEFL